MKILVTGGTGFIGSRLALNYLQRKYDVIILGQDNTPAEKQNIKYLRSKGIEVVKSTVSNRIEIDRCLRGVDIVVHLAAAQHEANVPEKHFWDVNVEGTRNLLELSVKNDIKRFIHGSTIGVYGEAMDGEINEETKPRPDNIYGITKLKGEELALSFCSELAVSVVRISETYGPGDYRLLKLFKGISRKTFFIIGNGENKHQLIYVDDLIEGIHTIVDKQSAVGEVFVLAGREVLTTKEMVNVIANVLDSSPLPFTAPIFPFYVAAIVLEKALSPLGIQPPLHRRRLNFFTKSFYFSREKVTKLLDFEPDTNFSQGIAHTADWYKERNML